MLNSCSQCENCEKNNWGVGKYGAREGVERVSPSPIRVGPGEPEFFLTFWLKIVHVGIYSGKDG